MGGDRHPQGHRLRHPPARQALRQGAEGPDSFDCSGLTSQAWLGAGHIIPRTSEEQWRRLKHVPVADMRPGDLIIYFADASHVVLYIGDGMIIQAPLQPLGVRLSGRLDGHPRGGTTGRVNPAGRVPVVLRLHVPSHPGPHPNCREPPGGPCRPCQQKSPRPPLPGSGTEPRQKSLPPRRSIRRHRCSSSVWRAPHTRARCASSPCGRTTYCCPSTAGK
ncbi:NlpC/P60 family protein [Streptomyces sp. NPDC005423]|uniref:C40 family peptidase n=1 Tax=Streptomyces sp. NPDC005423 TaxID=3155343 RepID=UPI0033A7C1E1